MTRLTYRSIRVPFSDDPEFEIPDGAMVLGPPTLEQENGVTQWVLGYFTKERFVTTALG